MPGFAQVQASILEGLLTGLVELVESEGFHSAHRVKETDFTRRRCLTLPSLVFFVLQHMGGTALQEGLDTFFGALSDRMGAWRTVSKSALSQARKKLRPSAFVAMNRMWTGALLAHVNDAGWHDRRVVAADGTCVRVPGLLENVDRYGVGPCGDGTVPMARCVALYAVKSRQWLEVAVGRYDEGERELLLKTLDQLDPSDILVLDRGYPAWWLFAALQGRGVTYCARIEDCNWKDVQSLVRSERRECRVSHKLSGRDRAKLRAYGLPELKQVELRLIKLRLPTGKWEVLATSLTDGERYPAEDFGELYRGRWGIEEGFKLVKHRQHLEGFSGELPESVEQEIQAKIMLHNIVQAVCHKAQQDLQANRRDHWQVNRAYAFKWAGRLIIAAVKGCRLTLQQTIGGLTQILGRTLERIRPNRSFPRKHAVGGAQRPRKSYR